MTMVLVIIIPDAASQDFDWRSRFEWKEFFTNEKTNFDAVICVGK
jgi:hypothetical protein